MRSAVRSQAKPTAMNKLVKQGSFLTLFGAQIVQGYRGMMDVYKSCLLFGRFVSYDDAVSHISDDDDVFYLFAFKVNDLSRLAV